jgi:hypothetical protein
MRLRCPEDRSSPVAPSAGLGKRWAVLLLTLVMLAPCAARLNAAIDAGIRDTHR